MKLRIKGNTIRLRLTKSEIEYFGNTSFIEEQTGFKGNMFSYSLKTADCESIYSTFENNNLTVFLPPGIAKKWLTTELVGLNGEMEIENGKKLYLLVEKDFKCLDETVEDQSDNFENPLSTNQR